MLGAQMRYIGNTGTLAARLAMAVGALALSGCFLDGEGHMQPGAGDAAPDAFPALDGAMLDAFVPAMDAAAPVDAGPLDAGLPGDDGGVPMDAFMPMDAGTDAGPPDAGPPDTGPPDTGPPDTGPPPLRSCDDLYGGISGVTICTTSSSTTCRLFYDPPDSSSGNCATICGAECERSVNNQTGLQCTSSGSSTNCDTNRSNQICICNRVP